MRTILFFLALTLITFTGSAQTVPGYDSTKKHEVSASFMPILIPLSGGSPGNYNSFQLGYRRYYKNRHVLRTSVSWFPFINQSYYSGITFFDRRVGDKNVFKQYETGGGGRAQINIGLEKIFYAKTLQHGIGADLFFNHMYSNRGEKYFYRPDTATTSIPPHTFNDYVVDSLGYFNNEQHLGVGVHLFYTIRLKMSPRWYFSATIGPTLSYAFVQGTYIDRRRGTEQKGGGSTFDLMAMPFISDFSLCFRF